MSFLEDYLDSIANIPLDVKRNFALIRELDEKSSHLQKGLNPARQAYLGGLKKNFKSGDKNESVESKAQLEKIRTDQSECLNLAEEKIELADEAYKKIVLQIRRLEEGLALYEQDSRNLGVEDPGYENIGQTKRKNPMTSSTRKLKNSKTTVTTQKQPKVEAVEPIDNGQAVGGDWGEMTTDDIPYCYCQKPSFGEMVGCDNPHCAIEWFHFACVGLETKPKGEW
eukprot:CAMPEP_0115000816 /NCGR_PEP_ID=MMETSP0216-20121206/16987_1 /TAXON_ID=223996 /ORGANISM="Protocruzia adherens, Strain Boccale" /LENGTH=224 /DNA_ID=CAMNT_0002365995 /DNA_START=40 /DNA_END=711 /DNA_ORIENTATION=+